MLGLRRTSPILLLAVLAAVTAPGCAYEVKLVAPPAAAESTKVFAADGTLITTLHAEQDREEVSLDRIAPTLQRAVIAIEDARFFQHQGIDLRALARAIRENAQAGAVKEGGSTITQQYVKNVLLDPEQTVHRKVREAVLAFELERRHTKETILERYLNRIYFGNGAYGVQAAAVLYFGKGADGLSLPESALLAGLIQAPERHDPFDHPDAARQRRNVVLERMHTLGMISSEEAGTAGDAPLGVATRPAADRYPAAYFVERVKRFVLDDERFGATPADRRRLLFEDGLRIHTTVDLTVQRHAEEAVSAVMPQPGAGADVPAAAAAVIDPGNGFVRALVGGRDFFGTAPEAKFDLATQGRRQSGSSFKPLVLAAALAGGVPLERVFPAPGSLTLPMAGGEPPWVVENYEGSGGPPMNLTEATVSSVNTVYAQLIDEIGPTRAVEVAREMGIRSPLRPVPSAVLGTNEVTVVDMASAYSTLAGDGMHSEPVFVTEITRGDGSVLYRRPSTRRRVLPADVARRVNAVLEEVVTRGTGTKAAIGRPVAGKTGTAQQWRDAWFVGYTPDLVGAVWVGFPDQLRSMVPPATPTRITGGSWPAEIWQRMMAAALAGVEPSTFPPPAEAAPPPPPPRPATITVPDVAGLPEAEARARLEGAGLVVTVERQPSRDRHAGAVSAQTPIGGSAASAGAPVTMVVSTGPPRAVLVPDVVGETAVEATRLLQEAGLAPDIVVADPPAGTSVAPGRIWQQSPPAGSALDEGTAVRIWARR